VADLVVDGAQLVLHLSWLQKVVSFHADIRVPLGAVRSVEPVDHPWLALRGHRMAGTALRGVAAMGTWTHGDRKYDFCVLRGQQKAVQVDIDGGRFARFLVGVGPTQDPAAVADRLAEAAGLK